MLSVVPADDVQEYLAMNPGLLEGRHRSLCWWENGEDMSSILYIYIYIYIYTYIYIYYMYHVYVYIIYIYRERELCMFPPQNSTPIRIIMML
jgi:hypothetical protein